MNIKEPLGNLETPVELTDLHERDFDDLGLPPVLDPSEVNDENKSLLKADIIPQYILDNSPLVHLYSEEEYWPADIADYVTNFKLMDHDLKVTLQAKINSLNDLKSEYTAEYPNGTRSTFSSEGSYMTSLDNFDANPRWLLGHKPEYGTGYLKKGPAVLIVVDKGNGWVDAFWFYFYPFNWGAYIMGYGPWGNHVGDWEHSLVRFYREKPKYLWMSAHSSGTAYKYEALETIRRLRRVNGRLANVVLKKPVIFSAKGTHANYASVGQHPHDVPFFFMPLSDFTDRGPLWDPSLNFYGYTITQGQTLMAANELAQNAGTSWLSFSGAWGDKKLPWSDKRQKRCPVQWKYIDGPTGPMKKNLQRVILCQSTKWFNFLNVCPARSWIKRGQGLDAERNDLIGDNCGILLYKIRPKILREIIRFVMWRGVLCNIMEYFTG